MKDYNQYITPPSKKKVTHHPLVTPTPQYQKEVVKNARTGTGVGSSGLTESSISNFDSAYKQRIQQQKQQQPQPKQRANQFQYKNQQQTNQPQQTFQQQNQQQQNHEQQNHEQQNQQQNQEQQNQQHQQQQQQKNDSNSNYQQQQQQQQKPQSNVMLSAADALSLRRDGAEATILKLRKAVEEATAQDSQEKGALAKSDAVILELRSSVRQLRRQLEKVQEEKAEREKQLEQTSKELQSVQNDRTRKQDSMQENQLKSRINQLEQQLQASTSQAKEERVGELQIQLDRAHAQILTADMVRKELEDTLEAEQYTWELRVQDQDRIIQELQQECATLALELEQSRGQWKEAEDAWAQEVNELRQQLEKLQLQKGTDNGQAKTISELRDKIVHLEQERGELQSCLDEALHELEAVDAELQQDIPGEKQKQLKEENLRLMQIIEHLKKETAVNDSMRSNGEEKKEDGRREQVESFAVVEQLQHLWRLVKEKNGVDISHQRIPTDSMELLSSIRTCLQKTQGCSQNDLDEANKRISDLEAQISVYRGDLRAREESGAELRASLKEAVALLKPLQDAVAKAERHKGELNKEIEKLKKENKTAVPQGIANDLRNQISSKNREIQELKADISSLNAQLNEVKEIASAREAILRCNVSDINDSQSVHSTATTESSQLQKARNDLKAKRQAEQTLKQLLNDAQNRFNSISQKNYDVETINEELHGRLKHAEEQLQKSSPRSMTVNANSEQGKIAEMEKTIFEYKEQLSKKEALIQDLSRELENMEKNSSNTYDHVEAEIQRFERKINELESQLSETSSQLEEKTESEKVLNDSLKEALSLLKPLQTHLEDAEDGNKKLAREVRHLRNKIKQLEDNNTGSPSSQNGVNDDVLKAKRALEETVRQLEKENSQLHDALEEMSRDLNVPRKMNEGRLKEEIVEIKSRYEVTQSRLEDSYVENHTLVEALKKREEADKAATQELQSLREKLRRSEEDLENAKSIATSALVKVEQMTMANVEQLNVSRDGMFDSETHTIISLERKARELLIDLDRDSEINENPNRADI